MMQLTDEQRNALIVSLERRIKNAKRWLSSNKSVGSHEGEAIELISIYEIALVALTAPPAAALKLPDEVLIHSEMDFIRKEKAKEFNRCIAEIKRLNASASAINLTELLPDEKPDWDDEDCQDIDYMEPSEVYRMGKDDGWNAC